MRKKPHSPTAMQLAQGNAISKACAILHTLSIASPLRLNEIAEATGLNRVTALRVLEDLTDAGFLSRTGTPPHYDFGSEIHAIAAASSRRRNPRDVMRPGLLRLAALSGDTVLLSIRAGAEAICVERVLGDFPIRANFLDIGSRRPLGVGAGSMALLASLPEAERSAVVDITCNQLNLFPGLSREKLLEYIHFYDQKGYVAMYDVVVNMMGAIGVPVVDAYGNVLCSVSIVALTDRIRSRENELAEATIQEIRTAMGLK